MRLYYDDYLHKNFSQIESAMEQLFLPGSQLAQELISVKQQTTLLFDSLKAVTSHKRAFTAAELMTKGPKITGASATGIKSTDISCLLGEVAIYEGLTNFLNTPGVKEQYGFTSFNEAVPALFPIDIRSPAQASTLSDPNQRLTGYQISQKFRSIFGGSGGSISDYLLQHARPIESKARKVGALYFSDDRRNVHYARKSPEIAVTNQYVKDVANKAQGVVVGFIGYVTEFEEITTPEYTSLKNNFADSLAQFNAALGLFGGSEMQRGPKHRKNLVDKVFRPVAYHIETTIPIVLDKKTVNLFLDKLQGIGESSYAGQTVNERLGIVRRQWQEKIESSGGTFTQSF